MLIDKMDLVLSEKYLKVIISCLKLKILNGKGEVLFNFFNFK